MNKTTALIVLFFSLNAFSMDALNEQAYRQGIVNGCNSGHASAGSLVFRHEKDVDAYLTDAYYKEGWDSAYVRCRTDQMRTQQLITDSLMKGW
jgi:hypothetical protein